MALTSNPALADAQRRDRIADGDAARDYARTQELTADWIYEMTKRLMIELERNMKKIEDSHSSSGFRLNENAAAFEKCERTLARLANSRHGQAVLRNAQAESDDKSHLDELNRRLHLRDAAKGTPRISSGSEQS